MEELVEVEEDARHVGDEEHADDAHQDHPQLQVLGLKQREREMDVESDVPERNRDQLGSRDRSEKWTAAADIFRIPPPLFPQKRFPDAINPDSGQRAG